jgi:hypothetical protein
MSDTLPYSMKIYQTTETMNRICQMMLYRWCRSDVFVNAPGCGDLHSYLFAERKLPVSKRHLGMTIINVLDYECRKLKGVTKNNPKIRQLYYFRDQLEVQYGLEYMICAWLRKFLNDTMSPMDGKIAAIGDSYEEARHHMSEELDILANTEETDFREVYIDPLFTPSGHRVEEPNWKLLLKQAGAEIEESPISAPVIEPRKLTSYQ